MSAYRAHIVPSISQHHPDTSPDKDDRPSSGPPSHPRYLPSISGHGILHNSDSHPAEETSRPERAVVTRVDAECDVAHGNSNEGSLEVFIPSPRAMRRAPGRASSVWSGRRDLNPRQLAWEARTLPLSYARAGLNPTLGMSPSQERLCGHGCHVTMVQGTEMRVKALELCSANVWPPQSLG